MNRQVGCAVVVAVALLFAGGFVVWIADGRLAQDRLACMNNLRELGQFAALDARDPRDRDPNPRRDAVPPGTVVNPDLPPDRRLSWVADALLVLDQRQQPTAELYGRLDRTAAWDAGPNPDVARTRLVALVCPANPAAPPPGDPALTQYPGLSGVNPDAAALDLGPPVPPRAGGFRYDAPTPYRLFADGLSSTALFAETTRDVGAWLQGGPSTVRGLDVGPGTPAPVGVGGQFGGLHHGGANVAFADASVRFLTDRMSPDVFRNLVTIAGAEADAIPEED